MPEIRENAFKIFGDFPKAVADVGETSVGDGVNARFTGSTGTIEIYRANSTIKGTMDNAKLKSFFSTCGIEEIKEIKLLDEVYAPVNSSNLFKGLTNLTNINVGNWDTSKVTDTNNMFANCSSLTQLDVSKWKMSNVTAMNDMFNGCSSLTQLDVSNWDVSNVTATYSMFRYCRGLTRLNAGGWNTSKLTNPTWMFDGCKSLIEIDVSGWDVSNVTNMQGMYNDCNSLTQLDVGNWNTSKVTAMNNMFANCSSLTQLDVSNWDTSNVTVMWNVFLGCNSLTTVGDLNNWDTSKVGPMGNMFNKCSSLTQLNISNWNTSSVTNMENMFLGCNSLSQLDVGNWNTSSVTNMQSMFAGCSSLTQLDVSRWNVGKVTNMFRLFRECTELTTVGNLNSWNTSSVTNMAAIFETCSKLENVGDLSNWNTDNVTTMSWMFSGCSSLTQIDVGSWKTNNVTDMQYMFYGCSNLTQIDISSWDVSKVTNMAHMFNGCNSLTQLDVSNWDVSNVTNMAYMFQSSKGLTQLDVSKWNVSNVTTMESIFAACYKLTTVGDISKWDVSNVTNMKFLFSDCINLTQLDVSGWDVSNVTTMERTFYNCPKLMQLDVSKWNVSNVTDMRWLFNGCSNLTQLDVSNWDVSNVTTMERTFYNCPKLTQLDVGKWDTSKVTSMGEMFNVCENLTQLDVSNWDTSNVTSMYHMFYWCSKIKKLDLSNWDMSKVENIYEIFSKCGNLEEIYTPKALPEGKEIILPAIFRDIDKPEDKAEQYKNIDKNNCPNSKHLFKGVIIFFDLGPAVEHVLPEYQEYIKPKVYLNSEIDGYKDKNESLFPDNTIKNGIAILWDEEELNKEGYITLGWSSYLEDNIGMPYMTSNLTLGDLTYKVKFDDKNTQYKIKITTRGEEKEKPLLKGEVYKITGNVDGQNIYQEYKTDENGTFTIEDLHINGEYTLKQIRAAAGHQVEENSIVFKAIKENNEWKLNIISGEFNKTEEFVGNILKAEIESKTLLRVHKVDEKEPEKGLQGAKFTIKNLDKNENAKDINGNYLGEEENINGTKMRVVTTDEEGWIREPVNLGKYEITEVDSPPGYAFPEERTRTIDITLEVIQEEQIGVRPYWKAELSTLEDDSLERAIITSDGGRVFVGAAGSIAGESGSSDINRETGVSLIGKFNKDAQLVWSERIVKDDNYGYFANVEETKDKGLITVGVYGIIKYEKNETGEGYTKVWNSTVTAQKEDKSISYIKETDDGGLIVTVCTDNDIQLIDTDDNVNIKLDKDPNYKGNMYVIKYKKSGVGYKVEWVSTLKTDGTTKTGNTINQNITGIDITSDGGFVVAGWSKWNITLPDGKGTSNGSNNNQGNSFLLKYKPTTNGYQLEWVKRITGARNQFTGITQTTTGEYVGVGLHNGTINIPYKDDTKTLGTNGDLDGWIIKFDKDGNAINHLGIGSTGLEFMNHIDNTNDGGFAAAGSIRNNAIFSNGYKITKSIGGQDAIVLRFDKDFNIEFCNIYGGENDDYFSGMYVNKENNKILLCCIVRSKKILLEDDEYIEGEYSSKTATDAALLYIDEYIRESEKTNAEDILVLNEKIPDIEIEILKKWDNTNNKYGKPESVVIELTSNIAGIEKKEDIVIRKENKITIEGEPENYETWRYIITKPECTKYGEKIVYTIKEKSYTLE